MPFLGYTCLQLNFVDDTSAATADSWRTSELYRNRLRALDSSLLFEIERIQNTNARPILILKNNNLKIRCDDIVFYYEIAILPRKNFSYI